MIHRASKLHLPTLRDAPADAEALSHKLLVRGGFIRQLSAGLWTFLPLGWRVHRKVEQVIREELAAIGAQEMFAPVLTPAELWIKSGRYGIELFCDRATVVTTSFRHARGTPALHGWSPEPGSAVVRTTSTRTATSRVPGRPARVRELS
jgi:hypothetical protein